MKKRKPPILLGAILLILVGVVLAVNASSLPSIKTDSDQTVAENGESTDRPASKAPEKFVDKTDTGKDKVHQSVLTPEIPTVAKGDAQTTVKKIPALAQGAPLISAPRQVKYKGGKAGPNASGQWFRPESGVGKKQGS